MVRMILVPNWSPSPKARGSLKRSFVGAQMVRDPADTLFASSAGVTSIRGFLPFSPATHQQPADRCSATCMSETDPLRHRRGRPEVSAVEEIIWL